MKVVLLDEDRETYEVLEEIAKLSGSEIIHFDDIEKVKSFIDESPDIDGIIIEKYIKGKPAVSLVNYIKIKNIEIPIILLTAKVSEDEKDYFKQLGISAIMEKPFNPLEVMAEVVGILKELKGEEYIKQRLHADNTDRNTLKLLVNKLISILKKLFGKWTLSL